MLQRSRSGPHPSADLSTKSRLLFSAFCFLITYVNIFP
jgi:hypothetical protein